MVPPARDNDKSWILKFIACFLVSSTIAFNIFRIVFSIIKANEIHHVVGISNGLIYWGKDALAYPDNYEMPIYNFFSLFIPGPHLSPSLALSSLLVIFSPLFIPALTGIIVSSLWFSFVKNIEEKGRIISELIRFGISGGTSILTTVIATVVYIIPSFKASLYYYPNFAGYPFSIVGLYAFAGGLIGGLSSVLYRRNILQKLILILSLLFLASLIFPLTRFHFASSVINLSFFGVIFATVFDEWLNLYNKFLNPQVSKLYSNLSFGLTIFLGMAAAIWEINKA